MPKNISDSNSDEGECENPRSILSNLSEMCAKLKDVPNYFSCNNNDELIIDISQILLNCETEVFKWKLKILKQTKIEIF